MSHRSKAIEWLERQNPKDYKSIKEMAREGSKQTGLSVSTMDRTYYTFRRLQRMQSQLKKTTKTKQCDKSAVSGKLSEWDRKNNYSEKLSDTISTLSSDEYFDETNFSIKSGVPVHKLKQLSEWDRFASYHWYCSVHRTNYWALPEVLEHMKTVMLEA